MTHLKEYEFDPCQDTEACSEFPELRHLNYWYGQMLGARDFTDQQAYFLDKIALLNRCLHGYGVGCGLELKKVECPRDPCEGDEENVPGTVRDDDPAEETGNGNETGQKEEIFCLDCGFAMDPEGRELIVRRPVHFNLRALVQDHDFQRNISRSRADFSLYLTLCYAKHPTGKRRIELNEDCGCGSEYRHVYTRWLERPCIRITDKAPPQQHCEPCCTPQEDPCVYLARIYIEDRS